MNRTRNNWCCVSRGRINECSKTIVDIRELFPSDLQSLDNRQVNDVHIFRKPATRTKFATLSIRVRDGASTCQPRLATSSVVLSSGMKG